MNILIPDSWLREYLETAATPKQIKEYLSLCGPSVERIHKEGEDTIYDIEVTSNRTDSMSVFGVAREAAAILPQFGIPAKLHKNPYLLLKGSIPFRVDPSQKLQVEIHTDHQLNPRWTSIILDNISVKPSPKWLQKRLELTGIRPLNNIVDITNYILRAYGQPAHAFDFAEIKPDEKGIPYMGLRSARDGEQITTLDGKTHKLQAEDIVIEDGSGRLIDLCGIMGAENSSIKKSTKTILLFMQTYNPVNIRNTMMRLSHRTDAGSLFEKGLDAELVLPAVLESTKLVEGLSGAKVVSNLHDIYPNPYTPKTVSATRTKINAYIGVDLKNNQIKSLLRPLGLNPAFSKESVRINVPSFRRDIEIDVDIIEEIARMYGYHNIKSTLPDTVPPIVHPDKALEWEEEIKIRLRDWGFTETYTYSMISAELMDSFGLDKTHSYKISNPLSSDLVYMRPAILPSVLTAVKQNLNIRNEFKLFEISNIYKYQEDDLPKETPILAVTWIGEKFYEAKGLAEKIFCIFGLQFEPGHTQTVSGHFKKYPEWNPEKSLDLGEYGVLGEIRKDLLTSLNIKPAVTVLKLNFTKLTAHAKTGKTYRPIPKYPSVIEDLTFVFPPKTPIGEVLTQIKNVSPLISEVAITNRFQDAVTFRIQYLDRQKQIPAHEVTLLRKQIVDAISTKYKAILKGQQ